MISLQKINKYYINGNEKFSALTNIDLKIEKGDFISIIGSSGSGKSTLVKLLGLLDVDFEGEYILDGKNIKNLTDDQLSEIRNKNIGFVFQNFNLIKNLSVEENIYLPMQYQRVSKKYYKKRVLELLERVNLVSKMNRYPSDLSGGEQQRISIVRALVNNPSIIIADEPTGALDSSTSKGIMDIFKNLNQDKITIVVVTHDINVAKESKKIVKIFDGKIEEKIL